MCATIETRPCLRFGVSRPTTVEKEGIPVRIVLRKNKISIDCHDVTPEVLRYLLARHDEKFSKEETEIVLQTGSYPC